MIERHGHQCCPRRIEDGRAPRAPGEQFWMGHRADDPNDRYEEADHTCSYCGSLDPAIFMARLEAGTLELGPTDKSYKVYLRNRGGDPLLQHYRDCPPYPYACPVTLPDGRVDLSRCEHWVTRETSRGKFYFQHLSAEQQERFIELHNAGKLHIGVPGHFYSTPFFCRREPKA